MVEKRINTDFSTLHSSDFASKMLAETETLFTIKNLEELFPAMGKELNKWIKEQG